MLCAQQFTINGKVIDENSEAIAYANVILSSGETIVTGTSSDEDGNFSFENISKGNYTLKASYIGFESYSETIELTKNTTISNIILKESAESLDAVSVVVKKPTVKKQANGLVFNVENTALSEGNLLDVVRNTPSVLVLDDVIKVKNSSPTVYINDKKVNLSGAEVVQLLENSPANSIKSVEVITTPGAKYDASSGTVLNIVMSKNLIAGYRGSVFANYTQGVYPRYKGGISNFFKNEKISLSANYSYSKSKINRNNVDTIDFLNTDNSVSELWESNVDRNTKSDTHTASVNFDYFINDNNTLSLTSSVLFVPEFDYRITNQTNIFDVSNSLLRNFNAKTSTSDNKHNLGFDLDYVSKFKSGSKLKINTHYTNYDYKRRQDVSSNYFIGADTFDFATAFNTNPEQQTNIVTTQADYDTPINENATLSFGIKGSFVDTKSDISRFDVINNQDVFNAANSNSFDYKEDVFAAYLSYSESIGNFSFTGGLRAEQTNITGTSTNEQNSQDYLEWFPTVSLSHQVSDKVQVYSTYKRNILRPNYQSLNPFQFFLNDLVVVTGNPQLQPSFTNEWKIGTSINDTHVFEAKVSVTDGNESELPIQDNITKIITYTPTNIGETTQLAVSYEIYKTLFEKVNFYAGTQFYHINEETKIANNILELDQWSNYSIMNVSTSFLKDNSLSVFLSLTYSGKNLQGLQISEEQLYSDLFISKSVLNKKGTISLSFSDLFNMQDYQVSSNYLNQRNSQFSDVDTRFVKLGFSYKFGNTTLETNEKELSKKERDRLQGRN